MKNFLIRTDRTRKAYPLVALLCSIIMTGFGQIYNGNFLKGITLFILRTLPFLILPVFIHIKAPESTLQLFTVALLMTTTVYIWSAADAFLYAYNKKTAPRMTRAPLKISCFLIITIIITLFTFFTAYPFFSILKINNTNSTPLLKNGDCILTVRIPDRIKNGDLVLYYENNSALPLRVISEQRERVDFRNNSIVRNKTTLPAGIFTDDEIEAFGISNPEKIFSETNENRRYPVKFDPRSPSARFTAYTRKGTKTAARFSMSFTMIYFKGCKSFSALTFQE